MGALTPVTITAILIGYFLMLIAVSLLTTKNVKESSFYTGDKSSPWFVVSFGMIGASLSGVTFLSVPGKVLTQEFSYMQMVFGYVVGYLIVAYVLLPIYYKYNVVSIYEIIGERFGVNARKTSAGFFLLSRVIGASLRLYLVALVLDQCIFSHYQIPFFVSVLATIVLIWLYTFKGGIKTVVWTDMIQTAFMLGAIILSVIVLYGLLADQNTGGFFDFVKQSNYSQVFFWSGELSFSTMFFTGIFITVTMTGLDQDMMQKNLTIGTLKDAQKNMLWLSCSLVVINFLILFLGSLLATYSDSIGLNLSEIKTDLRFSKLAINYLPLTVGIPFVLGTVAAAYSSADSALTSLTTSFVKDFLESSNKVVSALARRVVHVGFSLLLFVGIIVFKEVLEEDVIWSLFKLAGLTYGPLLGIFILAIFTKIQLDERKTYWVLLLTFVISALLFLFSDVLLGIKLGFSISLISTVLTLVGCFAIARKSTY